MAPMLRHHLHVLRVLILVTASIAILGAARSPLVTRYIGYVSITLDEMARAVFGPGVGRRYDQVDDRHDQLYLLSNSIVNDWQLQQRMKTNYGIQYYSGIQHYQNQSFAIDRNNVHDLWDVPYICNGDLSRHGNLDTDRYQADSLGFMLRRVLLSLASSAWLPDPVPILTSSHALAHFLDQNWAIGEHYDYSVPFPFLALWAMYLATVALAVRIRTHRRGWAVSWPIFLNAVRCVPWWVVLIPAGWYFVPVFWAMMPYDHRYIDWRYRFESEPFSLAALSIGVVLTYAFSAEHAAGRALVMEGRARGASPPACTVCGYPLDGRSVCPECGPVSPRAVSRARSVLRRPGVLRWAVLGFFALGPVWIAGVLWAI